MDWKEEREKTYDEILQEEQNLLNDQARDTLSHFNNIYDSIPYKTVSFYTDIEEDRIASFLRGASLDTTELVEMTMYLEEIETAMQLLKEGTETIHRLTKDPYNN